MLYVVFCVLKGRSRLRQADTWLGAETWCWPSKEEAEGWQAGILLYRRAWGQLVGMSPMWSAGANRRTCSCHKLNSAISVPDLLIGSDLVLTVCLR